MGVRICAEGGGFVLRGGICAERGVNLEVHVAEFCLHDTMGEIY